MIIMDVRRDFLYLLCFMVYRTGATGWQESDLKVGDAIPSLVCQIPKNENVSMFYFQLSCLRDQRYREGDTYVSFANQNLTLNFPNVTIDMHHCHIYSNCYDDGKDQPLSTMISVGKLPNKPIVKDATFLSETGKIIISWDVEHDAENTYKNKYNGSIIDTGHPSVDGDILGTWDTAEDNKGNVENKIVEKRLVQGGKPLPSHITIRIRANNAVGRKTVEKKYQLCSITKLPKVSVMKIRNVSSRSAELKFTLPSGDPLKYSVNYTSKWNETVHSITKELQPTQNNTKVKVKLAPLIPYTRYHIEVFVQLKCSFKWSDAAITSVNTSEDVPDMAPPVATGGFEVKPNRNVRNVMVYWNDIPLINQNGKILYNIKYQYDHFLKSNTTNRTNFPIDNISNDKTLSVHVNGKTDAGTNDRLTLKTILIPTETDIQSVKDMIYNFTCIIVGPDTVRISWRFRGSDLPNVTVFYRDKDNSQQLVEWWMVRHGIQTVVKESPGVNRKPIQFGYSVNFDGTSSGIQWSNILYDNTRNAERPSLKKLGENSPFEIEVLASFGSENRRAYVYGYEVTYCKAGGCFDERQQYFLRVGLDTVSKITNLKPDTVYQLTVTGLTGAGKTDRSDLINVSTAPPALSDGMIAGVVIGGVILLIPITVGLYCLFIRAPKHCLQNLKIPISTPPVVEEETRLSADPDIPIQSVTPMPQANQTLYENLRTSTKDKGSRDTSVLFPPSTVFNQTDFPISSITDDDSGELPDNFKPYSSPMYGKTQPDPASSGGLPGGYASGSEEDRALLFDPIPDGPALPIEVPAYSSIGPRGRTKKREPSASGSGSNGSDNQTASGSNDSDNPTASETFDFLDPIQVGDQVTDTPPTGLPSEWRYESENNDIINFVDESPDSIERPPGYAEGDSSSKPFDFQSVPEGAPGAPRAYESSGSHEAASEKENSSSRNPTGLTENPRIVPDFGNARADHPLPVTCPLETGVDSSCSNVDALDDFDFLAPLSYDLDPIAQGISESAPIVPKQCEDDDFDNFKYDYVGGRIVDS